MPEKMTERRGERRYASARKRAEKKRLEGSFSATYLRVPDGVKLFKPKSGLMVLDILPYIVGKGNPQAEPGQLWYERTFHLHPRVGADRSGFLCRRLTLKKTCPLCDARGKLLRKTDDESEELVKELSPKERQLFWVINRKEAEKGPQLWDISYHLFGKQLDARIRNSEEDDNYDTFFQLEDGMTLKVGFKEDSYAGRAFLSAETIDFKPRPEPLKESILKKLPCLDDMLISVEYDKLKAIFMEALADEDEEEEEEEDDEPKKGKHHHAREEDEEEEDEDTDEDEDESEDEDEDEEDEEELPPKSKKVKSKSRDEDEEDEDEEDESEEDEDEEDSDEDEEDEPKGKSKKSKKFEDEDEEDESEEDESEEDESEEDESEEDESEEDEDSDEDEEDEPAPKSKKGKKPVEDEDEDEEEEDSDEDEDESDEDEEDEPKAKKKKGKSKDEDEDDDFSDFEVEDDEEATDENGKPRVRARHVIKKKRHVEA